MAFTFPCSFPLSRSKVIPLWVRVAYLLNRTLRILGGDKVLRFWLNAAWISNRMAVESCFVTREAEFRKLGFALREESLAKWLPEGATVLDIGCGIGEWSRIAAKYASRVVGTDFDSGYIAGNQIKCPPNVSFILSDATKGLPEGRFDVALLIHVLEHIDSPLELLREVKAKAKRLIIEVPNFEASPLNFIRYEVGCPFYADGDHVCEYRPCGLIELLTASGWHLETMECRSGSVLAIADRV
jgi:SAM-dependent methyltransferase